MDTPDHEGLRPLSPHGEGYCRVCRFIEGLTEEGLIERHNRRGGGGMSGIPLDAECEGSLKRPPKLTPHRSKLSEFHTKAKTATCPVCRRKVVVLSDHRLNGHSVAEHMMVPCAGGWKPVTPPGRDHGAERG